MYLSPVDKYTIQESIKDQSVGHPELVQSLDTVCTCTEMLLIFVPETQMDYRGQPADADGPKTTETFINSVFEKL